MFLKNKLIVTIFSFAIVSAIIYLSYKSGKNDEYESFSLFIRLIFGYLIAVVAGTIAITFGRNKIKTHNSTVFYIFSGMLNIMISIVAPIFIYMESGKDYNVYILFFLMPFIIGLIIFKNIYFNKA